MGLMNPLGLIREKKVRTRKCGIGLTIKFLQSIKYSEKTHSWRLQKNT